MAASGWVAVSPRLVNNSTTGSGAAPSRRHSTASHNAAVAPEVTRDRGWADTHGVAERMSRRYDVHVRAVWRRRQGTTVEQGLEVPTLGIFEVVRKRRVFSRQWELVKPVAEAAADVGDRLRQPTV